MWNIKKPDISKVRTHLDIVFPVGSDTIVASGQDKDAIEEIYKDYCDALGRPGDELLGSNLSDELKQAIHDAYKEVQDNRKLSELRAALKLLTSECPYCGFGQIQDLDHHLPKAVYKPFSIFPLNLVPSCTTCNRKKTRKPKVEQGETHLLHAYLEDVSQYGFLVAEVYLDIETTGLKVEYKVERPEGMDEELFTRLVNQLDEFDLNKRYPAQVNIYLGEQETALEQAYEYGGAEGLRSFLLRTAEKTGNRFGRNDWRTALLYGLASCDEFCDGGFVGALGYQTDLTLEEIDG